MSLATPVSACPWADSSTSCCEAFDTLEIEIEIESDDPGSPVVSVPVGGTGLSFEEQAADLLEDFDSSRAEGDLVGSGPGQSAPNCMGAIREMLVESQGADWHRGPR